MFYLDTDSDGYLRGICGGPDEPGEDMDMPHVESLDGVDLDPARMPAYRWVGERLTLDETRLAALMERERNCERQGRINLLKQRLTDTDYAVIKIAEGAATTEEYADIITQRQAWRSEINRLEVAE